ALCGFRRRLGAISAVSDEPRDGIRRDVAAGDLETGASQRGRHAVPHRAQSDDSDAWLLRFGHGGFLVFSFPWAALPFGTTAWPCCQSMRQGAKPEAAMTETRLREEI